MGNAARSKLRKYMHFQQKTVQYTRKAHKRKIKLAE